MVFAGGSAFAADLGGNCCADLEERVAELEATTARKGNRKVSLTITGWVSSQLYWFDDGGESNVYVTDNNNDLSSNFKFTGSAQIAPGWKAGYSLWIYTNRNSSLVHSSDGDDTGGALSVENSYWWIESEKYGKVSLGLQSAAGDNAVLGTDFSGTLFPANSVTFDGGFMRLRPSGQDSGASSSKVGGYAIAGRWHQFNWCESLGDVGAGIAGDCNGDRTDVIRYDSPTIAGFSLAASWGEDDRAEVKLAYAGEMAGFKLSLATAYGHSTDNGQSGSPGNPTPVNAALVADTDYWQIGGTVKHLASNLWLHVYWGQEFADNFTNGSNAQGEVIPDKKTLYIKAGWSPKLNQLGTTHFYGEYGFDDDAYGDLAKLGATCANFQLDGNGAQGNSNLAQACAGDANTTITSSDMTRWGLGVVQEIDAAAMSLWVKYRHHELDANFDGAGGSGKQGFDNLDMVLAGAVIFF